MLLCSGVRARQRHCLELELGSWNVTSRAGRQYICIPGRVCANGTSTCLVQETRELHGRLRDRLTRAFDKARTETIRTLSEDSRAWVLSMTDTSATVGSSSFLLTSVCPDNLVRPPRDSLSFAVPFGLTPASRTRRRPGVASIDIYSVFDS